MLKRKIFGIWCVCLLIICYIQECSPSSWLFFFRVELAAELKKKPSKSKRPSIKSLFGRLLFLCDHLICSNFVLFSMCCSLYYAFLFLACNHKSSGWLVTDSESEISEIPEVSDTSATDESAQGSFLKLLPPQLEVSNSDKSVPPKS